VDSYLLRVIGEFTNFIERYRVIRVLSEVESRSVEESIGLQYLTDVKREIDRSTIALGLSKSLFCNRVDGGAGGGACAQAATIAN